MKRQYFILLVFLKFLVKLNAQVKTASADTDWKPQQAVLKNTWKQISSAVWVI